MKKKSACSWCGQEFESYQYRNSKNVFCCKEHYLLFHSKDTVYQKCAFELCENKVRVYGSHNDGSKKYCSRKCYKLDFKPTNFGKNAKKGYYISIKTKKKIWFDSSYELRRMKQYDNNDEVLNWDRCKIKISYYDKTGKQHFYHPDFLVTYKNSEIKTIEEVKGILDENDLIKIAAAKHWSAENKFNYKVINFNDITLQNEIDILYDEYDNSFGKFYRISFIYTMMKIALIISNRSTCLRAKVGCVITPISCWNVFSFGYNGSPSGEDNACKSLEPGKCGCIHAEINALKKLKEHSFSKQDCILFNTTAPCFNCASEIIKFTNIKKVIYLKSYRDNSGLQLLRRYDIEVEKYNDLVDAQNEKIFYTKS